MRKGGPLRRAPCRRLGSVETRPGSRWASLRRAPAAERAGAPPRDVSRTSGRHLSRHQRAEAVGDVAHGAWAHPRVSGDPEWRPSSVSTDGGRRFQDMGAPPTQSRDGKIVAFPIADPVVVARDGSFYATTLAFDANGFSGDSEL